MDVGKRLWHLVFRYFVRGGVDICSVTDLAELEKRYLSCPELLRGVITRRYRELLHSVTDLAELEKRYLSCPGPLKYEVLGEVKRLAHVRR